MAALGRQTKMPDLKRFMRDCFPPDPNSIEAIVEMEEAWRAWAVRNKLRVEKLEAAH